MSWFGSRCRRVLAFLASTPMAEISSSAEEERAARSGLSDDRNEPPQRAEAPRPRWPPRADRRKRPHGRARAGSRCRRAPGLETCNRRTATCAGPAYLLRKLFRLLRGER